MVKAADRTESVTFAIGDVVIPARKLQQEGAEIMWLNLGDPDKFDFDTPVHIKEAAMKAMNTYNGYMDSEGLPALREAVASREKRKNGISASEEDILITNGTSEAIQMIYGALLNPGDEILIPGPAYPPYMSLARFFDAVPVPYRTLEEENWSPDIDDMRSRLSDRTKAILLISPNNPTGALYSRKHVEAIAGLAAEHDIVVVSDEIYDTMTFEEQHYSPLRAEDVPVIAINGMSKAYLSTGWRVGWAIFKDYNGNLSEIKDACLKQLRLRISANTVMQEAGVAALHGPQDHIKKVAQKLKERRDFMYKRMNEISGMTAEKPMGAFYIFPKVDCEDDKKFVLDVLENTHVLFVHGSGFGSYGKGHFRSIFLPPIETLEKAMNAVEKYMKGR
ncbi:MAG: aminotransferase class I/II-fold pyridoxal phosphate-dependent enzyme [Theionarchaea archaeon]|nr:aminotransferase class I/II-fold pyridoxal phosphate-dependent enzyme [Theionarchaea archaeon]MBU7000918.1 aminotransferase class I/II-fold pyridoxal phosphate-dependent enzyme [Theionarchaea archaeon]MBU7041275.1 aminotransferase class I/II-fold pyridoxal phosphate-dependent enzyme [Theionarchaea archaeon]